MENTTTQEAVTVQEIPLAALMPSTFNTRGKHSSDPAQLKDLADDITTHGVQQPILVRPLGDKFEIVFGARRAEASKLAGKETVPAIVRELSAEEAEELCVIENLQRANLHFLDEAAGFKRLLLSCHGASGVATKVGKQESYVHTRLALNDLIPKLAEVAYAGKLSVGNAVKLARLTTQLQKEFFSRVKARIEYGVDSDDVRRFIESRAAIDLAKAPFDLTDKELVPTAGACAACPKRSGSQPLLFADVKGENVCSDGDCYQSKCMVLAEKRLKEFPKAIKIMTEHAEWEERQKLEKGGIVPPSRYGDKGWKQSSPGACDSTVGAIVMAGSPSEIGTHKLVCAEPRCPVHGRGLGQSRIPSTPGVMNEERRKQVEDLWQRRTDHAVRRALHAAVRGLQTKDKDPFASVPLEVLRLAVSKCASRAQLWAEAGAYFKELWPEPKNAKMDLSGPLEVVIAAAKDRSDLLRILIDMCVCQDVAGKFENGDEIEALAKAYSLNHKAIAAPVEKEWAAKKAESYAKRDARLAKEREKAAKLQPEKEKKDKPKKAGKARKAVKK